MLRKKKILLTVTGLLVGASVFSITAFSALANNSVYDNYKKALLKTYEAENMSVNTKVSFKNQDGFYFTQESINKMDKNKNYTMMEIEESNGIKSNYGNVDNGETFMTFTDGKITYQRESNNSSYYNQRVLTDAQKKLIDVGIDTILGDTKNSIISEGNKVIANLEEHQIPGIVQALFSVFAEAGKIQFEDYDLSNENNAEAKAMYEILKLDNLAVKKANGSGEIDDNGFIESLILEIEIGGYDSSKNYKSMTFETEFYISDIGSTVVETPTDLILAEDYYNSKEDFVEVEINEGEVVGNTAKVTVNGEGKDTHITINNENSENTQFTFDGDNKNLNDEIN